MPHLPLADHLTYVEAVRKLADATIVAIKA